jgi:TetR/AcrR family fatty acid metabolism transcriptional regulator
MTAVPRVNALTRAETRLALLEAAADVFAYQGYHQARIDAVSETAGVAKGTVYNYFDSKEQVLHAVIGQACEFAADAAEAVPASAPTEARLLAFVQANVRWARERPTLALVFARELLAGDRVVKNLIRSAAAPCIAKVTAVLADGVARGELSAEEPPEVLAMTFIAFTNMLLLQGSDSPVGWPAADDLPAAASQLFLRGLSCRSSRPAPG